MSGIKITTRHMLFYLILKGLSATADGSDGSQLTELQAETTGAISCEILFPQERQDMPYDIVWRGCCQNGRNRSASVKR